MARINTRASSAAGPDDETVRQLDQARIQNDQKLKTRFERIFRKYEHNFEGVGDEIDIHSGEIVVDNGHLQHMRDEADPGRSASSRFVRTFQEKLGHEEESEEDEEGTEGDSEEGDDGGEEGGDSGSDDGDSNADSQSNDSQSLIEPFRALRRPPPRLAQLLVGGTSSSTIPDDQTSQDPSLAEDESGTATPAGLLEQVPALQDSMSALTGRSRRSTVDAGTIQALGTSIANQLAQLMAGPSKKRKRESQPKSRRRATDPVWDFPDIENDNRRKRKRSPGPVMPPPPPPVSSPPFASPGQRSLWAPEGSHQSKYPKHAVTPSLRRLRSSVIPSSAVRGSDLKRCMNCSFTNSPAWQAGPDGGDLCVSCGKYYDYHGRMKPFDSPTPSVDSKDSRDSSVEPVPEVSLEDSSFASAAAIEEETLIEPQSPPASHPVQPADQIQPVDRAQQVDQVQHVGPVQPVEPVEPVHLVEPVRHAYAVHPSRPQPPLEHHSVSTPQSERDIPPATTAMQPNTPHTLPQPYSSDKSTPTRTEASRPSVTPDFTFLLDTPETYPANTSRQLLSGIKSNSYSTEEDAYIIKLKEQYKLPWDVITQQMPQRTLFSIQNRYTRALHNVQCPARDLYNAQRWEQQLADAALGRSVEPGRELNWSHEQDEFLLELREEKGLEWDEIGSILPGHSAEAVEARYNQLVQESELKRKEQNLARKPWNTEDDARVVRLKEVDNLAWHLVAEEMEGRSLQSIQKRYSRVLAPEKRKRTPSDLTKGSVEQLILEADPELAAKIAPDWKQEPPFEPAEDELIKQLVQGAEYLDWQMIAAYLPGRSVRSVYLRYTNFIKSEQVSFQPENRQPEVLPPPPPIPADDRWRMYSPSLARSTRRTDAPPNFGDFERNVSDVGATVPSGSEQGPLQPFNQAEDNIIMQLKASHNASWEEISLRLPGRNVAAIAQRFTELLRAMSINIMTSPTVGSSSTSTGILQQSGSSSTNSDVRRYTHEEDELIAWFHTAKWSWEAMAPYFSNRTPRALEEHWHSTLRPKPRKRQSASTNVRAGLLRTALSNSRRRSDPQPRILSAIGGAGYGTGMGNVDDPITFEDDEEMAAASEQLFEEFRSSVVQKPSSDLQIDPQLLELDRATMNTQRLHRLMTAAERFATEQNNPRIVQQIYQTYHSNAEDPRLQQLLELTAQNGSRTPSELEWAFEAFDHAYCQPGRSERADRAAPRVVPQDALPQDAQLSMREMGKGKARECDATHGTFSVLAPVEPPRPPVALTNALNQVQASSNSPQPARFSDKVENAATRVAEVPARSQPVSQSSFAAPQAPNSNREVQQSRIFTSGSIQRNMEPLAASTSTAKTVKPIRKHVPAFRNSFATKPSPKDNRQHQSQSRTEDSPGASSRPKHSFSELIRMALEATRSPAMHPKNICAWVERTFDYYRTASPSWKLRIVKELKSNDEFEQCGGGIARPWRLKAAVNEPSPQPAPAPGHEAGGSQRDSNISTTAPDDDQSSYYSRDNVSGGHHADAEDSITVALHPRGRGRPRKRTTDSAEDVQEYRPAKAPFQPATIAKHTARRGRPRSLPKAFQAQEEFSTQSVPEPDLTIEIADSDGGDEISSSPAQQARSQPTSSGKRVRFVDTVEVKGPTRASATDATPSMKKTAGAGPGSDTREPDGSSSSPAKSQATTTSTKRPSQASQEAVPSSSPVFMKPTLSNKPSTSKAKPIDTPAPAVATPFPRTKSRLSQLRRESTNAIEAPPETPKTNWPRRHSTPTAIFSHRASPALGRGVMVDRFGFGGRKRIVETPVRELSLRKDLEEDELA